MSDFGTWLRFGEWIRATYANVHEFGPDLLRFDFEDTRGREGIGVQRKDGPGDQPWVMIGVKVCPAAAIPPIHALTASFEMPVGAMRIIDAFVVLGLDLPLSRLDEQLTRDTIEALVKFTRHVRPASGGVESKAYDHFAE